MFEHLWIPSVSITVFILVCIAMYTFIRMEIRIRKDKEANKQRMREYVEASVKRKQEEERLFLADINKSARRIADKHTHVMNEVEQASTFVKPSQTEIDKAYDRRIRRENKARPPAPIGKRRNNSCLDDSCLDDSYVDDVIDATLLTTTVANIVNDTINDEAVRNTASAADWSSSGSDYNSSSSDYSSPCGCD